MNQEDSKVVDDAADAIDGRSRWAAALESLVDAEKERFNLATAHDRTPQEVLSDVLEAANQKKTECMQKRWKIKVKGRTIILRDVLGKITTWVNKFAVSEATCYTLRLSKIKT